MTHSKYAPGGLYNLVKNDAIYCTVLPWSLIFTFTLAVHLTVDTRIILLYSSRIIRSTIVQFVELLLKDKVF